MKRKDIFSECENKMLTSERMLTIIISIKVSECSLNGDYRYSVTMLRIRKEQEYGR